MPHEWKEDNECCLSTQDCTDMLKNHVIENKLAKEEKKNRNFKINKE